MRKNEILSVKSKKGEVSSLLEQNKKAWSKNVDSYSQNRTDQKEAKAFSGKSNPSGKAWSSGAKIPSRVQGPRKLQMALQPPRDQAAQGTGGRAKGSQIRVWSHQWGRD